MFETDFTGAEELEGLIEGMQARDIVVALSRVHPDVLEMLERSGVIDRLGAERVFGRTEDAVAALPGATDEPSPPTT
jgi:MFS superfamily sulfate permease-like transporter